MITSAGLLPTYLAFLQTGVFAGLSRNLPLEIGANNHEKAHRLNAAAATFSVFVALLSALICIVFALLEARKSGTQSFSFWAYAATAAPAFAGPITLYVDTALRGLAHFGALSKAITWTALITITTTALVYAFGASGAIIRIVLCALIPVCLRMTMVGTFGKRSLDFTSLKELGLVGMPLMISGTFFSLLLASDRSIVAAFMTKEDVGMCSLASLIVNSLQVIPQSISMIIFPKMAQHYGRHRSRHGLRRFLLQSLALNAATVVPASLICYFSIPHLVEHLFPAYRDGIPAAKVASLTCLLWIYLGVGSIIGVTNRMRPYLAAMGLAILVVWIFGYYAVRNGYGVVGVAWARFVGTAILCFFTICYSWYLSTETGADNARDV